ncbi:protein SMAX1-LIKE 3 [Ziziphus jujuba]|uniref:Protein SMAX1-LIKE 3 n=1 Tax=Ziziphus jujuba TaxID=326968 RepID=A0A6P3ZSI6_ZIZJJ|nr:protein SMAX1-LIKE 3 [Ziziphus jujuba]
MRTGICTVQQALTAEATTMVKQAVTLAKRRGHAQVTPLHVASAMLATSNGLLRKACLQCHSHPLQCKALELCFNVALNRLPASNPSPILGPHYPNPSFSNALVAAFKRAQAHQRRGSIENQQQPILALKIELEQLIISILDDPSVSRVMREAGFSSTLVKNRVEQAVSLEICTQKTSPPCNSLPPNNDHSKESQSAPYSKLPVNSIMKPFEQIRNDDVMSVLNIMLNKRRNMVVVGESLGTAENVAKGVMEKFERSGNYVNNFHGDFRYNLQFVNLPLSSLRSLNKEEVEQKLVELRCIVMKSYMGRGVVLYLGDLLWVSEFWSNYSEKRRNSGYCAAEQIIMELKRLVSGIGDNGRLWLMGIATFQTYQRCKTGHPSLEAIWELHPLTIPGGSLRLSLNLDRDVQAERSTRETKDVCVSKQLSCCADCSENFDKEVQSIPSSTNIQHKSSLPSWLQKYREETTRNTLKIDQECITVTDLCKKWNSFCSSVHKNPQKTINNLSSSPSSSNSFSSYEHNLNFHQNQTQPPPAFGSKHSSSPKEYQFWVLDNTDDHEYENDVKMFIPDTNNIQPKPELLSNPNSSPNSASSSEVIMEDTENLNSFKELNNENIKLLCDEMGKKVDWQKEIVPDIVETILQCRSGLRKRKGNDNQEHKEESWLFFLGDDSKGKEMIARTLAKLIFGSRNNFLSIGLSSFSSTKIDSNEEINKKRTRNEMGSSYIQRFGEAVNENPHRVFFMEDVEQVDYYSQKGIKNAIDNGRIRLDCGETVPLKDAIVIFSCESFSGSVISRAPSPNRSKKTEETSREDDDENELEERSLPRVSLDLNIAIEDHKNNGDDYKEDIGILESVDMKILFKISEEL